MKNDLTELWLGANRADEPVAHHVLDELLRSLPHRIPASAVSGVRRHAEVLVDVFTTEPAIASLGTVMVAAVSVFCSVAGVAAGPKGNNVPATRRDVDRFFGLARLLPPSDAARLPGAIADALDACRKSLGTIPSELVPAASAPPVWLE